MRVIMCTYKVPQRLHEKLLGPRRTEMKSYCEGIPYTEEGVEARNVFHVYAPRFTNLTAVF